MFLSLENREIYFTGKAGNTNGGMDNGKILEKGIKQVYVNVYLTIFKVLALFPFFHITDNLVSLIPCATLKISKNSSGSIEVYV